MMQFTKDMTQAILDGKKTETRRPVREGEDYIYYDELRRMVIKADGRKKWLEGQDYAICPGRGKPQVARFELNEIFSEYVQDITNEAAIAEGFEDRAGFIAKWDELYKGSEYDWKKNPRVWVLKFELVASGGE